MNHYRRADCAVFCRVRDPFGALSNMHPNFPLQFGDMRIGSTEALYQALRYPGVPEAQQAIFDAPTPMASKHVAYEPAWQQYTRPDWFHSARVQAMQLALCVKVWSYPDVFREIIAQVAGRPIVEFSSRDPFWGAQPETIDGQRSSALIGENKLGQLWTTTLQHWQTQGDAVLMEMAIENAQGLMLLKHPMTDWLRHLSRPTIQQPDLF